MIRGDLRGPAGLPAPLEGTEMPPLRRRTHRNKSSFSDTPPKKKKSFLDPKARAPGTETSPNPRRGGQGNVSSSPLPPRLRAQAPRGSRQPRLSAEVGSPSLAVRRCSSPSDRRGSFLPHRGGGIQSKPPSFFFFFPFFLNPSPGCCFFTSGFQAAESSRLLQRAGTRKIIFKTLLGLSP